MVALTYLTRTDSFIIAKIGLDIERKFKFNDNIACFSIAVVLYLKRTERNLVFSSISFSELKTNNNARNRMICST